MVNEIREPRKNIPRAALLTGIVTVAMYVLTTFAVQATIPAREIGIIDGILQGAKHALADLDMLWLLPPVAVLISLNVTGNSSAWLAGSARIPFVIGIDRYLPPSALPRLIISMHRSERLPRKWSGVEEKRRALLPKPSRTSAPRG